MMRIAALMVFVLFCWTSGAEAQSEFVTCTTTTANLTMSTVQTAINSAADGDVICLPAGSATWSGGAVQLSNSKGVTIAGAAARQGAGATTITVGGGFILGMTGTVSGNNMNRYRITGFTFSGGGSGFIMWFYGPGTLNNLRIDHNTFSQPQSGTLLFFGENSTPGYFYGLIDHNTVTASGSVAFAQLIGGGNTTGAPAGTRGTVRNMYFEDNTINIASQTNPGLGCVDSWSGQSWVWRHNTTTNCLVTAHGVTHAWGPVNVEIYSNSFVMNSGANGSFSDCYRCFHHQGSAEFLAFDNRFTAFTGKSSEALAVTHYRSATAAAGGYTIAGRCDGTSPVDGNRSGQLGYPCKRQPGRDVNGMLQPMYVWMNRWSDTGAIVNLAVENPWNATNPSVANHVAANRDYYNAVSASAQTSPTSPFNGTTGMGFGTLANRPTTCTTNASEAGGGVGYFATDQGLQGTLYRCSATNTWTIHYTPLSYPHPMQFGVVSGAPSAPTSLRVIR